MAKTIAQIQQMITDKYDAREVINEIADYLQANPGGGSQNLAGVLLNGNDANGGTIENLADPTTNQQVATKKYVDDNAGGGGVQSVTYAQLVTLIGSNGLTVGQQYLITDFKTVHFIFDAAGNQYDINEGDLEPLIITAVDVNKIDSLAKSTTFPQDVIHVDFDANNWLDDLAFSSSGVIVTGWKGTITFRHDILLDNSIGYDFRNCKFRRWKTNQAAWNSGTTYAAGNIVSYSNVIYMSLRGSNLNKQPDTQNNYWVSLLNLTHTEYWNNRPTSTNGITSDALFADFKTFVEGSGSAIYDISCRNNHFGAFKDNNSFFETSGSLLPNNVIFLTDQNYYTIDENDTGGSFINNTIYGYFTNNKIASNFSNNQIEDDFVYNRADNGFGNNIISDHVQVNSFGAQFRGNTLGNTCGNNSFGNVVANNIFGDNCGNNTIGNGVSAINAISGFKLNQVQDNFPGGDFSGATHVYNSYNCTLFKREDGTIKLSYVNNSDVLTIVNGNA